jgi:hypothetical protein
MHGGHGGNELYEINVIEALTDACFRTGLRQGVAGVFNDLLDAQRRCGLVQPPGENNEEPRFEVAIVGPSDRILAAVEVACMFVQECMSTGKEPVPPTELPLDSPETIVEMLVQSGSGGPDAQAIIGELSRLADFETWGWSEAEED